MNHNDMEYSLNLCMTAIRCISQHLLAIFSSMDFLENDTRHLQSRNSIAYEHRHSCHCNCIHNGVHVDNSDKLEFVSNIFPESSSMEEHERCSKCCSVIKEYSYPIDSTSNGECTDLDKHFNLAANYNTCIPLYITLKNISPCHKLKSEISKFKKLTNKRHHKLDESCQTEIYDFIRGGDIYIDCEGKIPYCKENLDHRKKNSSIGSQIDSRDVLKCIEKISSHQRIGSECDPNTNELRAHHDFDCNSDLVNVSKKDQSLINKTEKDDLNINKYTSTNERLYYLSHFSLKNGSKNIIKGSGRKSNVTDTDYDHFSPITDDLITDKNDASINGAVKEGFSPKNENDDNKLSQRNSYLKSIKRSLNGDPDHLNRNIDTAKNDLNQEFSLTGNYNILYEPISLYSSKNVARIKTESDKNLFNDDLTPVSVSVKDQPGIKNKLNSQFMTNGKTFSSFILMENIANDNFMTRVTNDFDFNIFPYQNLQKESLAKNIDNNKFSKSNKIKSLLPGERDDNTMNTVLNKDLSSEAIPRSIYSDPVILDFEEYKKNSHNNKIMNENTISPQKAEYVMSQFLENNKFLRKISKRKSSNNREGKNIKLVVSQYTNDENASMHTYCENSKKIRNSQKSEPYWDEVSSNKFLPVKNEKFDKNDFNKTWNETDNDDIDPKYQDVQYSTENIKGMIGHTEKQVHKHSTIKTVTNSVQNQLSRDEENTSQHEIEQQILNFERSYTIESEISINNPSQLINNFITSTRKSEDNNKMRNKKNKINNVDSSQLLGNSLDKNQEGLNRSDLKNVIIKNKINDFIKEIDTSFLNVEINQGMVDCHTYLPLSDPENERKSSFLDNDAVKYSNASSRRLDFPESSLLSTNFHSREEPLTDKKIPFQRGVLKKEIIDKFKNNMTNFQIYKEKGPTDSHSLERNSLVILRPTKTRAGYIPNNTAQGNIDIDKKFHLKPSMNQKGIGHGLRIEINSDEISLRDNISEGFSSHKNDSEMKEKSEKTDDIDKNLSDISAFSSTEVQISVVTLLDPDSLHTKEYKISKDKSDDDKVISKELSDSTTKTISKKVQYPINKIESTVRQHLSPPGNTSDILQESMISTFISRSKDTHNSSNVENNNISRTSWSTNGHVLKSTDVLVTSDNSLETNFFLPIKKSFSSIPILNDEFEVPLKIGIGIPSNDKAETIQRNIGNSFYTVDLLISSVIHDSEDEYQFPFKTDFTTDHLTNHNTISNKDDDAKFIESDIISCIVDESVTEKTNVNSKSNSIFIVPNTQFSKDYNNSVRNTYSNDFSQDSSFYINVMIYSPTTEPQSSSVKPMKSKFASNSMDTNLKHVLSKKNTQLYSETEVYSKPKRHDMTNIYQTSVQKGRNCLLEYPSTKHISKYEHISKITGKDNIYEEASDDRCVDISVILSEYHEDTFKDSKSDITLPNLPKSHDSIILEALMFSEATTNTLTCNKPPSKYKNTQNTDPKYLLSCFSLY